MTATHSIPVTHRSFLSVQLATMPSSQKVPQLVRSVSNPPLDGFLSRPAGAAAGTAARSVSPPPRPTATEAAADEGDWRRFVDHLQQQGAVPGAGPHDPAQGVVTPANVSVKQMLALLRNQVPVAAAEVGRAAGARRVAAGTPAAVEVPDAVEVLAAVEVPAAVEVLAAVEVPAAVEAPARAAAALPCEDVPPHEADLALDEELRMWAETYRPRDGEPATVEAQHEEEDFDVVETFGTTPRAELASLRRAALKRANAAFAQDVTPDHRAPGRAVNVTFNACGTVREYALDAEPDAAGPVPDQLFLTKKHDGKWMQEPMDLPFMPTYQVTMDDDDEFVVHAPRHRDRSEAPTHAEHQQGQVFWTDLGRDDAPDDAVGYLQRLNQLQAEVDESLRRNRQMNEDIGVYF